MCVYSLDNSSKQPSTVPLSLPVESATSKCRRFVDSASMPAKRKLFSEKDGLSVKKRSNTLAVAQSVPHRSRSPVLNFNGSEFEICEAELNRLLMNNSFSNIGIDLELCDNIINSVQGFDDAVLPDVQESACAHSSVAVESFDRGLGDAVLPGVPEVARTQIVIKAVPCDQGFINAASSGLSFVPESPLDHSSDAARTFARGLGDASSPGVSFVPESPLDHNVAETFDRDLSNALFPQMVPGTPHVHSPGVAVRLIRNSPTKRGRKGTIQSYREHQANRLLGKTYKGIKRSPTSKKQSYSIIKQEKVLKARCSHGTDKSACGYHCFRVSDKKREEMKTEFWGLPSWLAKRVYVRGLVTTRKPVLRRAHVQDENRRKVSNDCFLLADEGDRVKVCRSMFLATFCIGRDQFSRWTTGDGLTATRRGRKAKNSEGLTSSNEREKKRKFAEDWIDALPKTPSHYCRATTSKTYVDASYESLSGLHRLYVQFCKEEQQVPLSRQTFMQMLEIKHIAIHLPRKDQCDICTGYYNGGSVDQPTYEEHVLKKDEAKLAKIAAKNSVNETKVVVTMDLQSVLICPRLKASMAYYKRKLQIHNFTIFRLNDKHVKLYVWDEANGGVGANEFSSCIADYISKLPDTVSHVVLISDGCCGQNRNAVLASCLRDISLSRNIVIEQLILERGHTMMEADSVHAVLEKKFKNHSIYTPTDYVCLMRNARLEQPYEVEHLDYRFFKKYDGLPTNLSSIRPGN